MKNFLDELEVPQPPYRMARLAVAEEPPALTPAEAQHLADPIKPKESDEDYARRTGEPKLAKEDEKWSQFSAELERENTPEQVDVRVDQAAIEAEQHIDANPSLDVAAKTEAKGQVEKVRTEYHEEVASREGRTPDQVVAEFNGKGKKLGSIEDEYESTEAALRRAEESGNQKEIERLTGLAKQYSDAIEKKNTTPSAADVEREKLQAIRDAATKAVTEPATEPARRTLGSIEEEYESAKAALENAKKSGESNKEIQKLAGRAQEYADAIKKKEVGNETINQKPKSTLELTDDEKSLRSIRNRQAALRAQGKNDEADSWELRAKELEGGIRTNPEPQLPKIEKQPSAKEDLSKERDAALEVFVQAAKNAANDPAGFEKAKAEFTRANQSWVESLKPKPDYRGASFEDLNRELPNEIVGIITDIRDIAHKVGAHTPAIEFSLHDLPEMGGLRQRVKELLDQETVNRSAGDGGQPPPKGPEKPPQVPEEPEQGPKQPKGGAREALREIEKEVDPAMPDFWETQAMGVEARMYGVASWWNGIWAKRAKDALAKRDVKLHAAETKAKQLAESSWLGTAFSPIVYGPRIAWHRMWRDSTAAEQERYDGLKSQHENARNEVLNMIATRLDGPLLVHAERIKKLKKLHDECEKLLEETNKKLIDIQTKIANEPDAQLRALLAVQRDALQKQYRDVAGLKQQHERALGEEDVKAGQVQYLKNDVLRGANPAARSKTAPAERERLQQRVKRAV
jgi:hypothetical protein